MKAGEPMLIRMPDYAKDFHCLAGACPHSCCAGWEVVLDEETARRYSETPGELGDRLRAAMGRDEEGDLCFPLEGGRCPFLDRENLCEIHRRLGQEATSVTCREHPRFTEDYGPFREVTFSASCPAANALLLGSEEKLTFLETETDEPPEEGDPWLSWLLPLRERLLDILTDRAQPLRERLKSFLLLAAQAQALLEEERETEIPALAASWVTPEEIETGASLLFPAATRFLGTLGALEPDWRALLKQAETASGRLCGNNRAPSAAQGGTSETLFTGDGRSLSGIPGATERSEALDARANTGRPAHLPASRRIEANRRESGGIWAGGGRDSKQSGCAGNGEEHGSGRNFPCGGGMEPSGLCDDVMERIAAYFAFRYLLKAVNDGGLLSRAQLVVFAVLVVERLAAVCGLSEALRRFSCELEHNDQHLEALLDAFRLEEAFSPRQLLAALRR